VSLEYREVLASLDGQGLMEEELASWTQEECGSRTPPELAALLFDAARLSHHETRLMLALEHGDDEATATLADLYDKTGRRRQAAALTTGG